MSIHSAHPYRTQNTDYRDGFYAGREAMRREIVDALNGAFYANGLAERVYRDLAKQIAELQFPPNQNHEDAHRR